jgi:hypothetical protein
VDQDDFIISGGSGKAGPNGVLSFVATLGPNDIGEFVRRKEGFDRVALRLVSMDDNEGIDCIGFGEGFD